jgi:hypothetical protein
LFFNDTTILERRVVKTCFVANCIILRHVTGSGSFHSLQLSLTCYRHV